jgi:hypothetical protein
MCSGKTQPPHQHKECAPQNVPAADSKEATEATPVFCMNAVALKASYWTETEYADLDLGDARLNKRARTLMERLFSKALRDNLYMSPCSRL